MFQINQNNLHLLLPGKVSWLVEYLHDDYGFSLQECLNHIYRSKLYKKLSTESTKYWHLGPVDLYNELKADREMASFKAPENGILLYGGYVADKWVAIPVAEKLKPGGKLGAFDKIATIVPPDSELIVQATLPDSTATPKVGETVVIKITNMQIPGVITEASPIPGADGKRRIIITPKVPASQIFAPGLPVQVTIKDQQA